jgi:hypothetical protein
MATRQISSDMGNYMSYIKFLAMSCATKHVVNMERRARLSPDARSSEWEREYNYRLHGQSPSLCFRMGAHIINWLNSLV